MLLAQRVSIVTGASQGIGEAIAQELAQQGASVALVDIQQEKLQEVAQKIKAAKGEAWPCPADVTSFEEAARVVDEILNKYQRIDHLVNNAGITKDNLLMRMKEEEWDAVLAVNLKGVFNFCRAAIRSMVANRYGRIVNLFCGRLDGQCWSDKLCGFQSRHSGFYQIFSSRSSFPGHHC